MTGLFKNHECDKCGRKFRKIEELMQHHQVIHGKDLLYDCKECGVGFTGMEQMRDHAKKFHSYNKMLEDRKKEQKD
ncbi:MAG: hypothetical protein DA330_03935 [Nitrososphaera sp.]|jgi:KRAB domain-containing zinc finger protein|nr:hypothetical protein [Nitrososphaera sp.]